MSGRRKAWEDLSDSYRKRLSRAGITKESHQQGRSLSKARGHTNQQYEVWRSHQRNIERYAESYVSRYDSPGSVNFTPPSKEDIVEELRNLPMSKARQAMNLQREMERLYDKGYTDRARALYEQRDKNLPDILFYYHGAFS